VVVLKLLAGEPVWCSSKIASLNNLDEMEITDKTSTHIPIVLLHQPSHPRPSQRAVLPHFPPTLLKFSRSNRVWSHLRLTLQNCNRKTHEFEGDFGAFSQYWQKSAKKRKKFFGSFWVLKTMLAMKWKFAQKFW
jgi:hypothetical protein